MAVLTRRWGLQKPPPGAPINFGHPLARNLIAAVELAEGGGRSFERVTGRPLVFGGSPTPSWTVGPYGTELGYDAARLSSVSIAMTHTSSYAQGLTLQAFVLIDAAATHGAFVKYGTSTTGVGFGQGLNDLDNSGMQLIGLSEFVAWEPSGFTLTSGWHDIVMTVGLPATTYRFYVDGRLVGSRFDASPPPSLAFGDTFSVGGYGTTRFPTCHISFGRGWLRTLSTTEVEWLHAEPYAFMAPKARRFVSAPAVAAVPYRNPMNNAVYRM